MILREFQYWPKFSLSRENYSCGEWVTPFMFFLKSPSVQSFINMLEKEQNFPSVDDTLRGVSYNLFVNLFQHSSTAWDLHFNQYLKARKFAPAAG